jgi:hypothetical protein
MSWDLRKNVAYQCVLRVMTRDAEEGDVSLLESLGRRDYSERIRQYY